MKKWGWFSYNGTFLNQKEKPIFILTLALVFGVETYVFPDGLPDFVSHFLLNIRKFCKVERDNTERRGGGSNPTGEMKAH